MRRGTVPGGLLGADLIIWGPLRQARDGLDKELPPGPFVRDPALWLPGPEVGAESVLGGVVLGPGWGRCNRSPVPGRPLERNSFLLQTPVKGFVSGVRWRFLRGPCSPGGSLKGLRQVPIDYSFSFGASCVRPAGWREKEVLV